MEKFYGLYKRIFNYLIFFSTWDKKGLVEARVGIHMLYENQGAII